MKRGNAFFVVLAVFFVSFVLNKVIFAEQAVVSKDTGINNTTNPFEDAHMRPKEFSPDRNKPNYHEIDPLYQRMEKRERDPYKLMDNARFLNRERDRMMNKYSDGQSPRDLRKKGPDEKGNSTKTSADTWKIEAVDSPKYFDNFYSRGSVK